MNFGNISNEQMTFLELFKKAADLDCLYLIDFHCHNLYGHDQTTRLSDIELAHLSHTVSTDIRTKVEIAGSPPENRLNSEVPRECQHVAPLPLRHLETGLCGEEESYLFNLWRKSNGTLEGSSRLTGLSMKMHLTLPDAEPGKVPRITFIGQDTTLRKLLPCSETRKRPVHQCFPKKYKTCVAKGYHCAFQGEPVLDVQRTGPMLDGEYPDITLQRLLLKFTTAGGFERVFALTRLLQVHDSPGYDFQVVPMN